MVAFGCNVSHWTVKIDLVSPIEALEFQTYIDNLIFFSLEMLDKMEPPPIPDGYGISIAYACLLDIVRSISLAVEGPSTVYSERFSLHQCSLKYFV